LNLPAQTRDEKDERMMRNESMNVAETPGTEKLFPRQQRQKMLSHRLSRQRLDRGLSPLIPDLSV